MSGSPGAESTAAATVERGTDRPAGKTAPRYRFGFVLTTAAGNMTRYINWRKYADRDPEVECVWAPIKHYLTPEEETAAIKRLPRPVQTRAIVMHEAAPVLSRMPEMDVVLYHAFEPYVKAVMGHQMGKRPLVGWCQDNPPIPGDYKSPEIPRYGDNHARPDWRRSLRFKFDRWCVQRTDVFVPYSHWGGEMLVKCCGIDPERIEDTSVGIDLELWPYVPKTEADATPPGKRLQILFVGGDFVRKGGDLLLSVWKERFQDRADLHFVTKQPPTDLPAKGVYVYTDMSANDARLRKLYAESDIFVLPTRADVSSWVAVEGMATGRPVIATRMGGIPDIVRDGETGYLITRDDGAALADRIERLMDDPSLRIGMGVTGRKIVEQSFSAEVCVPRILGFLKRAVEKARLSEGAKA